MEQAAGDRGALSHARGPTTQHGMSLAGLGFGSIPCPSVPLGSWRQIFLFLRLLLCQLQAVGFAILPAFKCSQLAGPCWV